MTNKIEDVEREILDLLAKQLPEGTQVSAEMRIARDLGLDSVGIMDFVMDIEDRFDISIPLDLIAELETVADLCAAARDLLKGAR